MASNLKISTLFQEGDAYIILDGMCAGETIKFENDIIHCLGNKITRKEFIKFYGDPNVKDMSKRSPEKPPIDSHPQSSNAIVTINHVHLETFENPQYLVSVYKGTLEKIVEEINNEYHTSGTIIDIIDEFDILQHDKILKMDIIIYDEDENTHLYEPINQFIQTRKEI